MHRNFKGLKRYESLLHTVCRTDDYDHLNEREWEGCLGVACTISVIEGVAPTIFALSKHLDIPHYNRNFQKAFERLRVNGIFTTNYDIKNDFALTGRAIEKNWRTEAEVELNAWCLMAGIASGLTGIREYVKNS